MKIIAKQRAAGKTYDLIKLSAETGKYIVTYSRDSARQVSEQARKMGVKIPFPIAIGDLIRDRMEGSFIRSILIDNLDLIVPRLIAQMTNGIEVDWATITIDVDRSR